jgi:hypothetical protein
MTWHTSTGRMAGDATAGASQRCAPLLQSAAASSAATHSRGARSFSRIRACASLRTTFLILQAYTTGARVVVVSNSLQHGTACRCDAPAQAGGGAARAGGAAKQRIVPARVQLIASSLRRRRLLPPPGGTRVQRCTSRSTHAHVTGGVAGCVVGSATAPKPRACASARPALANRKSHTRAHHSSLLAQDASAAAAGSGCTCCVDANRALL